MDRTMRLNAIIRLIETHVRERIGYDDLEKAVGLSYRQLREDFRVHGKQPLKRYILSRKIAYAAFEIETTDRSLTEIAADYGFDAYDTFTRAFKRETSMTPSDYRRSGCRRVRRGLIGMGAYGPVLSEEPPAPSAPAQGDFVLYGVPKVAYSTGKCTPFPACLESLLAYLGRGEDTCSYPWLTAATGIAFRLCWRPGQWDAGGSDIQLLSATPWEIFSSTFRAAGWTCDILSKETATKQQFIDRIRSSLAKGHPAIALGVIGPPEACLLTGCRADGETLLGWSYFQENPEFTADAGVAEGGYFQTSTWWDNPATLAVMTLGEEVEPPSIRQVLQRIHGVLTADRAGAFHAGQRAYDSWAEDILDDKAFDTANITPILLERFFCQADGETAVGEGRYWAAQFFDWLGGRYPHLSAQCHAAANRFRRISRLAQDMTAARHGEDQTEEAVLRLCDPAVRKEIAALLRRARDLERQAASIVQQILMAL